MNDLLEVDKLTVSLGALTILRDVSLRVKEGQIVCLIGSNGVGKTTLMRTISGIYRNASGAIRFAGRDIANRPPHAIVAAGLSQAPEGRHIFSAMTVEENLRVSASTRRGADIDATMQHNFELFPLLRDRLLQKAGSLSGGEQQMLCIARALMAKPRLLLLDEPSLGLAPLVVRLIFDLIGRIRDAGTAVLVVEQNARAALRIADHAYLMEGGRIAREGPAAQLAGEDHVAKSYLGGSRAAVQ